MRELLLALILSFFGQQVLAIGESDPEGSDETPDFDQVVVSSYAGAGSGCVSGSGVQAKFSNGKLVLLTGDLDAVAGPDHRRSESREFCEMLIDLDIPTGWTYAIKNASGKVNTRLGPDTRAVVQLTSRFAAGDEESNAELVIEDRGEGNRDFIEDMLDQPVFAPCDVARTLMIKLALRVEASRRGGELAVAAMPGPTAFEMTWKRCPQN